MNKNVKYFSIGDLNLHVNCSVCIINCCMVNIFLLINHILLQGVLQARGILSDDFGCVHLHIADPVSIRQFANGRIDRVVHALEPRLANYYLWYWCGPL